MYVKLGGRPPIWRGEARSCSSAPGILRDCSEYQGDAGVFLIVLCFACIKFANICMKLYYYTLEEGPPFGGEDLLNFCFAAFARENVVCVLNARLCARTSVSIQPWSPKKRIVRTSYSVQTVHVVISLRGSMRLLTFCCILFFADIWPSRTKAAGYYVVGVNLQTHILPNPRLQGY